MARGTTASSNVQIEFPKLELCRLYRTLPYSTYVLKTNLDYMPAWTRHGASKQLCRPPAVDTHFGMTHTTPTSTGAPCQAWCRRRCCGGPGASAAVPATWHILAASRLIWWNLVKQEPRGKRWVSHCPTETCVLFVFVSTETTHISVQYEPGAYRYALVIKVVDDEVQQPQHSNKTYVCVDARILPKTWTGKAP